MSRLVDTQSNQTLPPFVQTKRLYNNYSSFQVLPFTSKQQIGNDTIFTTILDYPTNLKDFFLNYKPSMNSSTFINYPNYASLFGPLGFFGYFNIFINNVQINEDSGLSTLNGLFINKDYDNNDSYKHRLMNYQDQVSIILPATTYQNQIGSAKIRPRCLDVDGNGNLSIPFKYFSNLFNQDSFLPEGTLIEIKFNYVNSQSLEAPLDSFSMSQNTVYPSAGFTFVNSDISNIFPYFYQRKLKKNIFPYSSNLFSVNYRDLRFFYSKNFSYNPQTAPNSSNAILSDTFSQYYDYIPSYIYLWINSLEFTNVPRKTLQAESHSNISITESDSAIQIVNLPIPTNSVNTNFISLYHMFLYFKTLKISINDHLIFNFDQDILGITLDEFIFKTKNIFVSDNSDYNQPINSYDKSVPYVLNLSNYLDSKQSFVYLSGGTITVEYNIYPRLDNLYSIDATASQNFSVVMMNAYKKNLEISATRKTTKT